MMDSKTRAKLRSYANTVEAILQVGKNGMGETLQKQVDDALTARELISDGTGNCPRDAERNGGDAGGGDRCRGGTGSGPQGNAVP